MLPADSRKNELYQLVHSLDAPEKAAYRKNNRPGEKRRLLHLQLFDLIEQSTANEEKLFMKKMGLASPTHFSGIKNRLWNNLLQTLSGEVPGNPAGKRLAPVTIIETLLRKNLGGAATRLLATTWEAATQNEYYDLQLRLIPLHYRLLTYSDHKYYQQQSGLLQDRHQLALRCFELEQQLRMLARELIAFKQFSYLRLNPEQQDRLGMISSTLQQIRLPDNCPLLQMLYTFNECAAAHHALHFSEAQTSGDRLLSYWKTHPHQVTDDPEWFLNCADYYFYNAFALKDVSSAEKTLREYTALARSFLAKADLERWEIMAFHTQLKICHKRAEYPQVAQLISGQAKSVLVRIYHVLPPVIALSIVSSICISYFVLEQFDKAEDLLLDISEMNRNTQKEDIVYFIHIFYLLILLEKKSYLQLNHAISSAYFRLYNKKKLQPFEKDLMLFLKHLTNEFSEKGRIKIISNFLQQLDTYRNDPVKDLYFLFFNYYGWLESKVQKIPYAEYMRRRVQGATT